VTEFDPLKKILEADEAIEVVANARTHRVIVTDRRLAIADDSRVALHIPYPSLRRIQFDIERQRPATLVIVPETVEHEPQVLAIAPEHYDEVGRALAIIGRRLAASA
jgi:hypothetical protein